MILCGSVVITVITGTFKLTEAFLSLSVFWRKQWLWLRERSIAFSNWSILEMAYKVNTPILGPQRMFFLRHEVLVCKDMENLKQNKVLTQWLVSCNTRCKMSPLSGCVCICVRARKQVNMFASILNHVGFPHYGYFRNSMFYFLSFFILGFFFFEKY